MVKAFNPFLFTLFLFFAIANTNAVVCAQQSDHQGHEDSVQYIMPSQKNAELGLLVPPSCFTPSTAFNGYLCMANGAAILMHMLDNISYPQATRGMNDAFYAKNGFTYITSFDLHSQHGVKGKVYKLGFKIKNEDYIRYTVFAGDLNRTLWFNATYPKLVDELMELELLKSFQTITLNPADNETK